MRFARGAAYLDNADDAPEQLLQVFSFFSSTEVLATSFASLTVLLKCTRAH